MSGELEPASDEIEVNKEVKWPLVGTSGLNSLSSSAPEPLSTGCRSSVSLGPRLAGLSNNEDAARAINLNPASRSVGCLFGEIRGSRLGARPEARVVFGCLARGPPTAPASILHARPGQRVISRGREKAPPATCCSPPATPLEGLSGAGSFASHFLANEW